MSETKPFERVINIKSEIRQGYSPSQAQTWLDGILVYHASEFEDAVNTGEKLLREAYAEIESLKAASTYDGQTAKEWHDAWDRADDRWQELVQHHEELESAAKELATETFRNKPLRHELVMAARLVQRIVAVGGSAPASHPQAAQPEQGHAKLVLEMAYKAVQDAHLAKYIAPHSSPVEPQPKETE